MPLMRGTSDGVFVTEFENLPGGKRRYTHIQRVDEIAMSCKELRKDPNRGMSKGRTMQHIARIPEAVYFSHPEFIDPTTGKIVMKELRKFLQSPEGELFRATEARI